MGGCANEGAAAERVQKKKSAVVYRLASRSLQDPPGEQEASCKLGPRQHKRFEAPNLRCHWPALQAVPARVKSGEGSGAAPAA